MTVEQYRNLTDLEKDQTLMYLKGFEFEVPTISTGTGYTGYFTRHMLSIDWYYNQRFKEREKKPEISWPPKLSKKEEVVCKLSMMQTMLQDSFSKSQDLENAKVTSMLLTFIKSAIAEVYRHKSSLDGPKFAGIPEDIAQVINAFYPGLIKSFRKKFAV